MLYGKTLHNLRFTVEAKGKEWGWEGCREAGKAGRENEDNSNLRRGKVEGPQYSPGSSSFNWAHNMATT